MKYSVYLGLVALAHGSSVDNVSAGDARTPPWNEDEDCYIYPHGDSKEKTECNH